MLNDGKNPNNKRIEKRSVSLNVYMMLLIGRDAKKKEETQVKESRRHFCIIKVPLICGSDV